MQDINDPGRGTDIPEAEKSSSTMQQSPNRSKRILGKYFKNNKKYTTIAIYTVITFFVCLVIYNLFGSWERTSAAFSKLTSTLMPFLGAFLIAYFINPMAGWIDYLIFYRHFNIFKKSDRKKRAAGPLKKAYRLVSIILAYVIVIGFIVLVLSLIIPNVVESIGSLVSQLPSMVETITGWIKNINSSTPNADLSYVENLVNLLGEKIVAYIQDLTSGLLPKLYTFGKSFVTAVINFILAFVVSCYISVDSEKIKFQIKRIIYALFREPVAERVVFTLKKSNTIFSSFITGKVIDSLIIGSLCFLIMTLLRLDYAVVLSLIVGITNMIPYFGPFIGAIPGVIVLLIISPVKALIFVVMILLLQQFDGNILGPKIIGESTGLKPIWVIFAIIAGGAVAGPIGMFLDVPIVAVIVFILSDLINFILSRREISPDLSNIDPKRLAKIDHVFIYDDPKETQLAENDKKEEPKKPQA